MGTRHRIGNCLAFIVLASTLLSACRTNGSAALTAAPHRFPVGTGQRFRDQPFAPELVVLPAGSYLMGSTEADAQRDGRSATSAAWERPQHRVQVASLAVGRFLVTRGEYVRFAVATGRRSEDGCMVLDGKWQLESGRSHLDPGFPQSDLDPAVCVVVADAVAYTQWLTAQTHHRYRLLREAEWEYAARAGTATSRWWGNDAAGLCTHANGADQSFDRTHPGDAQVNMLCDDHYAHTSPGNAFPANGFGLHDMLGNVWQWTDDCFVPGYAAAPATAATAVRGGDCTQRVIRGGSWHNYPDGLRAATRYSLPVTMRSASVGFRIARLADNAPGQDE